MMRKSTPVSRAALARRRQRNVGGDQHQRPPITAESRSKLFAKAGEEGDEEEKIDIPSRIRVTEQKIPVSALSSPRHATSPGSSSSVSPTAAAASAKPPTIRSLKKADPYQKQTIETPMETPLRKSILGRRHSGKDYTTPQPGVKIKSEWEETESDQDGFDNTDDDDEQDNEMIEEMEPQALNDVLDASCLAYESMVMLKPLLNRETVSLTNEAKNDEDLDSFPISACGAGLGKSSEIVQITRTLSSPSRSTVHYGDSVSFYSGTVRCFLGINAASDDDDDDDDDKHGTEVGFFRDNFADPVTWEVLHGNRLLRVGSAAVRAKKLTKPHGETHSVRSGDPVVLRNHETGGLLSVKDGHLTLVTDSYDSDALSTATLVDKVRYHDRITPSQNELFQIIQACVPPCPQWSLKPFRKTSINESTTSLTETTEATIGRIKEMTFAQQERLLLDEVIGSLMGLEGELISINREENEYHLRRTVQVDTSLRNIVHRILRLATSYARVRAFLTSHHPAYEYGHVMQAFCEAIDFMLEEYLVKVASLEESFRKLDAKDTSGLTLNRLFVDIQESVHTLSLLELVVGKAEPLHGGALLNVILHLRTNVYAGDAHRQEILGQLLEHASIPYMRMLSLWLQTGVLQDPYKEFMINRWNHPPQNQPTSDFDGDRWSSMFQVREEHVLDGILSPTPVQERVLTTGKYWNAVQYCRDMPSSRGSNVEEERMEATAPKLGGDPAELSAYFDNMYRRASVHLLRLLLEEFQIDCTLQTMKRYFLLDQGDFLLYFLDAAESELRKGVEDVSRGRTQHWLNMAVQLTEGNDDIVQQQGDPGTTQPLTAHSLRCRFAAESLVVQLGLGDREPKTPSRDRDGAVSGLTGMTAFTLDFPNVPFPTSLVLSKRILGNYQLLFRHIFFTKHVEQRLVGIWLDHQMMKEFQSIRGALGPTFCLRQRMLHFVQNLIYYMMLEVIEPNWLQMEKEISRLRRGLAKSDVTGHATVDDLIKLHSRFLERTLNECLLTNQILIQSLTKLMSTCLVFSEQMKRFVEQAGMSDKKDNRKRGTRGRPMMSPGKQRRNQTEVKQALHDFREDRSTKVQKRVELVERELLNETYKLMIRRYEDVFNTNLADFMKTLNEDSHLQSHLTNLRIRLDYNGYISKHCVTGTKKGGK